MYDMIVSHSYYSRMECLVGDCKGEYISFSSACKAHDECYEKAVLRQYDCDQAFQDVSLNFLHSSIFVWQKNIRSIYITANKSNSVMHYKYSKNSP